MPPRRGASISYTAGSTPANDVTIGAIVVQNPNQLWGTAASDMEGATASSFRPTCRALAVRSSCHDALQRRAGIRQSDPGAARGNCGFAARFWPARAHGNRRSNACRSFGPAESRIKMESASRSGLKLRASPQCRNCGYHRRNTSSNSLFNTLVRVCSNRCAPCSMHCIRFS